MTPVHTKYAQISRENVEVDTSSFKPFVALELPALLQPTLRHLSLMVCLALDLTIRVEETGDMFAHK